jgi:hypothetical protein
MKTERKKVRKMKKTGALVSSLVLSSTLFVGAGWLRDWARGKFSGFRWRAPLTAT